MFNRDFVNSLIAKFKDFRPEGKIHIETTLPKPRFAETPLNFDDIDGLTVIRPGLSYEQDEYTAHADDGAIRHLASQLDITVKIPLDSKAVIDFDYLKRWENQGLQNIEFDLGALEFRDNQTLLNQPAVILMLMQPSLFSMIDYYNRPYKEKIWFRYKDNDVVTISREKFFTSRYGGPDTRHVYDFIIMPDGKLCYDWHTSHEVTGYALNSEKTSPPSLMDLKRLN